ncbi:hypothetical protein D3C87_1419740 [compost metagenome]
MLLKLLQHHKLQLRQALQTKERHLHQQRLLANKSNVLNINNNLVAISVLTIVITVTAMIAVAAVVTVTIVEVAEAIANITTILVVISVQAIVMAAGAKKTLTRLMIHTERHPRKLKMLIWQISS